MRARGWSAVTALAAAMLWSAAPRASAHCDTVDGPVVKEAMAALEAGDVTPVLKWVRADREAELRAAFEHTRKVRVLGAEARELADRFFFETLVRVHRDGEGAPYTGLKPAGVAVDPAISASDRAVETGDVAPLAALIAARADSGLRERFARAAEAKRHAPESVEKGRAYVAAYVELMHYAERLLQAASTDAHAHAEHAGHEAAASPSVGHDHGVAAAPAAAAAPASPAVHKH
jgi:hypothetical protein